MGPPLAGNTRPSRAVEREEGRAMARTRRRRTSTRRRYGYRRGQSGIDPLFWVALGVAVLIALFVVVR
jgi:hypothetical protein